jgi:hypothetical protein
MDTIDLEELPAWQIIETLMYKYIEEGRYYKREYDNDGNNMFWASAARCSDFVEDLKKINKVFKRKAIKEIEEKIKTLEERKGTGIDEFIEECINMYKSKIKDMTDE